MNREDIVAVAVRLFSVFLFLITLRYASGLLMRVSAQDQPVWKELLYFGFTVVTPLMVAFLLWFFPLSIARKFLPVMKDPAPVLSADAQILQELGPTLLGLWLLANALSDAFYWLAFLYLSARMNASYDSITPDYAASIFETAIRMVIGLWLVLGSRGIVAAIRHFRNAGR